MPPSLTLTIRTANRRPKNENYLGVTVQSLIAGGVAPEQLHLVLTDLETRWLHEEIGDLPVVRHVPTIRREPNANGLAQVAVLDVAPADWLLMLEDDIAVCPDFIGSVTRWLEQSVTPEVQVYRFCAFGSLTPIRPSLRGALLREQRGSQAIALRADDAKDLAVWAASRGSKWRPYGAPFQDQSTKGFDKLVGYWALDRWPEQRMGYVSDPHLVKHIGWQSGLYPHTCVNDAEFIGGRAWIPQERSA